jgi:hypothetical protein
VASVAASLTVTAGTPGETKVTATYGGQKAEAVLGVVPAAGEMPIELLDGAK